MNDELSEERSDGRSGEQVASGRGRGRGMKIFLTILPLWLFISTGFGWWLWNRGKETGEAAEVKAFQTPISAAGLAADMRKITEVAGPRDAASERGATGLRRAAALIQGSLGPENAGYVLEIQPGPETAWGSWPIIIARLPGEGEGLALVVAYDAASGDPAVPDRASGLASLLAVAQAMAGQSLGRPVSFAFVPHGNDPAGPVAETAERMRRSLGAQGLLLVIEALGVSRERLIVSARDFSLLRVFKGRAAILEAAGEVEGGDLSSVLAGLGAPVVKLTTELPGGGGDAAGAEGWSPDPEVHVEASLNLVELVARLASLPPD